ncbi:MAG: phage major capsid protein [Bacteroidales bacterium]|nr:phage major capsid protein [Bacteroidales bacterium]
MATILEKGTLFTPELVAGLFNLVKGKSSIAALCGQTPIPFTGSEIMTFNMDQEVALVGESVKKAAGSATLNSVKMNPVKVEYGVRVSDEFLYASEEKQLDILTAFSEGFSIKLARGLDIMAMHGYDPRSKSKSDLITNSFADVTNVVTYDADAPDDNLQDAIDSLGDYISTGMALSKDFASAMGKVKANGIRLYPEFAFGAQSAQFAGAVCSVNTTVNYDGQTQAIVGDFATAFRWGFAREIPLRVIEYGDPDNTGVDLAGSNQVYLRSEAYLGWGVLDTDAFCKIAGTASPESVKTASAKKA